MRLWIRVVMMLCLAGLSSPLWAQDTAADEAAIRAVVADYLSKDAARLDRALHPEVCRMMPYVRPQMETTVMLKGGFTEIKSGMLDPRMPVPELQDLTIHVIKGELATATLTTQLFTEELLLAKMDGQWRLINLLQKSARAPKTGEKATDAAAIEATSRDYIEGAFSGDGDRMKRALHYDFNKVFPRAVPGTGMTKLQYSPYALMISFTSGGLGKLPEDQWAIHYRLLHKYDDIAMAEVLSSQYYDYVQLARIGDQWQIVNVLWVPNPEKQAR